MNSQILMSIKPIYSDRIFNGQKRWELRRQPLRVKVGDIIFVYASSPTQAVVGAFTVSSVISKPVHELWTEHHQELGIEREDYFAYFDGTDTAYAIQVGSTTRIEPITLADLRSNHSQFRPPQSYMYWSNKMRAALSLTALQQVYACTSRIELQCRLRFQYPIIRPSLGCAGA